jgi:hypothetical protein
LAYPLACPEVDRVVVGVDGPEQLTEIMMFATGRSDMVLPDIGSVDENLINPANWSAVSNLRWTVNLSPAVPLRLEINGGAGRGHFAVWGVNGTALTVTGGAGEIDLMLPALDGPYEASVNGGLGEIKIAIASGAALKLNVRSGVGSVVIDTPGEAAVHVDARLGLGETQAGTRFIRVGGSESDLPFAQHSVWETPGFADAARPITIRYEGGVGSLNVR